MGSRQVPKGAWTQKLEESLHGDPPSSLSGICLRSDPWRYKLRHCPSARPPMRGQVAQVCNVPGARPTPVKCQGPASVSTPRSELNLGPCSWDEQGTGTKVTRAWSRVVTAGKARCPASSSVPFPASRAHRVSLESRRHSWWADSLSSSQHSGWAQQGSGNVTQLLGHTCCVETLCADPCRSAQ